MFTQSEIDLIKSEYKSELSKRKKVLVKIWAIILIVAFIFSGILLSLVDIFSKDLIWVITYPIIAVVTSLIGLIIVITTVSEKPAFTYLYDKVYKKICNYDGVFYEYSAYDKTQVKFNIHGGLFTKYARIEKERRRVEGALSNGNKFTIYDTRLVSGGGKNKTTHFDGIYFVISSTSSVSYQIRTRGKPKTKGTSYTQFENENIKIFVEEGRTLPSNNQNLIRLVERVKQDYLAKKVYLSVVHDEIHFAFVPKNKLRKQKTVSRDSLQNIYESFKKEISLLETILETIVI